MFDRVSAGLVVAAACTLLGACAETSYVYRPSQQATASVSGLPAARYPVPPERPMGEVLVVSSGVTEIQASEGRRRLLFVRMLISNSSDESSWSLDTRQQVAFIGGQRVSPAYVNPFKQPLPIVPIALGERRAVDFYFPLPPGRDSNDEVPVFEIAWSVQTSERLVAERTSFDRMRVEPVYAGSYYGYYGYPGWGPYYYGYDPFWPHYGYGVYVGYGGHYPYGYGGHYRGGYGGYGYGGHSVGRTPYLRATPRVR